MDLEPCGRFEWERLIKRARLGPGPTQHIALLLATYADKDGSNVRPGTLRLMRVSEKSRSSVCRALSQLRDLGLIECVFNASLDGRKGSVDEYRLTMPPDLLEHIPMLDPEENQVSPVTRGWPGSSTTRSHP